MITFVKFARTVNLGTHGRDSWSAKSDAQTPGIGKITVVDKNSHLLFTYEAGDVKQRIKVPLSNIDQVTEIDDPPPAKEPKP